MKHVFKFLMLLAATFSFGQANTSNEQSTMDNIKIRNVEVSVTVDSAEDIQTTFDVKDFNELIDLSEPNEPLSFEMICNGDMMSNGKHSTLSYRVKGNTNDSKGFLKSVKKIRKAAINYYKNKQ